MLRFFVKLEYLQKPSDEDYRDSQTEKFNFGAARFLFA